jgi:spermidine synthase
VVGLGVGSLAAYGMTGHQFTFFEIDPLVEQIARDSRYFHYLEDCRADWRVVLGDARLSLAGEADASFNLIVLDAFSGDAIPMHLLTREALRIYLAKLADGGLIALHISNNYLDLAPALAELARDAGLVGLDQNEETLPSNEYSQWRQPSHWVVLARRPNDLSPLTDLPGWRPLVGRRGAKLWTDDYTDLLSLVRWR